MGPLPQPLGLTTRRQQLQQLTKTITPQPGGRAPDLPAELRLSRLRHSR